MVNPSPYVTPSSLPRLSILPSIYLKKASPEIGVSGSLELNLKN